MRSTPRAKEETRWLKKSELSGRRVGTVVSDKMDKTIVVAVLETYSHPLYKKTIRRTYKPGQLTTKTTSAALATE